MKYLLTIVATAVLVGGGVYYWQSQQAGPAAGAAPAGGPPRGFGARQQAPPLVAVAAAERTQLFDTVEAIGTAGANESLTITAKVTDTVRAVDFEDGDYVEEGAVLVQLTNREEEALLAEARANLDDAETQLARLVNLAGQNLISESELDIARSRAEASRARLDTVLARLSDRLILAPFAGALGFRQVSPGTLLQPNTAITTLDDISTIKLDFTVPETFLGAMTPGAAVLAHAASYPDRQFEGVVRTVGSRVDPVTRAIQIRAHIPNDERLLRPGMLLTVEVVMAEREALVVPENSVFQIQDRAYIYVVDSELIAHERQIQTGERRFGIVEVLGGLEAGERIVTEGIVKLRDGARVRLTEPAFEVGTPVTGAGG
ncbi:MAG TPA: efflux RND transporter periplasmic adaptor subunit [Gammaproteobacteria bacterium]|nr:efflux RND transporter periplasmic adaptor subunit [Gammaproteobacteria bacterium]